MTDRCSVVPRTNCLMDPSLDLNGDALPWTYDQEHLARLCAENLTDAHYSTDWFVGRHDIHIDEDIFTYTWGGRRTEFRFHEYNSYVEIDDQPAEWMTTMLNKFYGLSGEKKYDPFKPFAIIRNHPQILEEPRFIPVALSLVALAFLDDGLQEAFIEEASETRVMDADLPQTETPADILQTYREFIRILLENLGKSSSFESIAQRIESGDVQVWKEFISSDFDNSLGVKLSSIQI